MEKFWKFMHDGMIIRRIILIWALAMSTWISIVIVGFTESAKVLDVGLAAVLGAILTPILGLTGYIIKSYAQHKYSDGNDKNNNEVK